MVGTLDDLLYDPEDEHIVRSRKWYINDQGYAVWRGVIEGKKVTIRLHRLISNTPPDMVCDHINRNRLDNRKSNLRNVTIAQNNANGCGNRIKRVYHGLPTYITFDKARSKFKTTRPPYKRFNTLQEAVAFIGGI